MLDRIFAAPISDFLYWLFSIFCVLAGVGELNWRVKSGGLGQKVSACSDKYYLSEGESSNQYFYSKDFCDSKNFC